MKNFLAKLLQGEFDISGCNHVIVKIQWLSFHFAVFGFGGLNWKNTWTSTDKIATKKQKQQKYKSQNQTK